MLRTIILTTITTITTIVALASPGCGPDACMQADEADADETSGAPGLCATHPFGRAIGCGGIEEPQTEEACQAILAANIAICTEQYVACRDAIRLAACDECPVECDEIDGAC